MLRLFESSLIVEFRYTGSGGDGDSGFRGRIYLYFMFWLGSAFFLSILFVFI